MFVEIPSHPYSSKAGRTKVQRGGSDSSFKNTFQRLFTHLWLNWWTLVLFPPHTACELFLWHSGFQCEETWVPQSQAHGKNIMAVREWWGDYSCLSRQEAEEEHRKGPGRDTSSEYALSDLLSPIGPAPCFIKGWAFCQGWSPQNLNVSGNSHNHPQECAWFTPKLFLFWIINFFILNYE